MLGKRATFQEFERRRGIVGEELKKVSMKWDENTFSSEQFLLEQTAGLVEGRSHLSRVVYRIARLHVSMHGIVNVLQQLLQDKQSETASDEIGQGAFHFPPSRTVREGAGSETVLQAKSRPRVIAFSAISRRGYRPGDAAEEMAAYKPPRFLVRVNHVKSVLSTRWGQAS